MIGSLAHPPENSPADSAADSHADDAADRSRVGDRSLVVGLLRLVAVVAVLALVGVAALAVASNSLALVFGGFLVGVGLAIVLPLAVLKLVVAVVAP